MNNKPIYRMSSAGYCPRRLSASRLELAATPIPDWVQSSAEEGKWHEKRIKDELISEGNFIYNEQEELKIEAETFMLVGHIDGKIKDLNNNIMLLECKSMSRFQFDRWMRGGFAAFPEYAAQLACYFYGTKLDNCYYVVKNRDNGKKDFRIVNKNESLFELDPIIEKITNIEELAINGDIFPAVYEINSYECSYCEYKYLCLEPKLKFEEVDRQIIANAAEAYREGKRLENRAKEILKAAQFTLETYAKLQPDQKLFENNISVSFYSVPETTISYTRKAYTACKIKDYNKEEE